MRTIPKFLLGTWFTICLFFGSSVPTVSIGQVSDGINSALSKDIAALDYEFWLSIKDESNPAYFREYLKKFPEGIYAGLVQARLSNFVENQEGLAVNQELTAENLRLKTELQTSTEKNLTLEQQFADLVSLKTLLEQRIESLGDEKIALEGDKAHLLEENRSTTAWLSTLLELKQSLEREVGILAEKQLTLEQEKAALLETIDKPKQEIIEESLALTAQLWEAETDRTELKASRSALEREVAALIEHRLTLEQEKTALVDQTSIRESEMLEQARNLRAEIKTLVLVKSRLAQEKTNLEQQIDALAQQQAATAEAERQLAEDLAGSQARYRLTKTELDYLVAKHADEILSFEKEKTLLIENLQAFELLKDQYGDLETAYNRLGRPARNMVGRHVVKVRYWKESGRFHYSLQEPERVVETEVSEDELHQRLRALKAAHPGNLYTYVLFPGGKDISHEEAYLFERAIVSRYDYYESD